EFRRVLFRSLLADLVRDDLRERSAPVGGLPDGCRDFVQREQARVHRRHHDHLLAQLAGGDLRTARDVTGAHAIISICRAASITPQASFLRVKIMRYSATLAANSHAALNTDRTVPSSCAKKRMLR